MRFHFRFLVFVFILNISCLYSQNHVQDSALIKIHELQKKNYGPRIKDSIRALVLKEELMNIVNPKTKELEKYKDELKRINQADSIRYITQKNSIDILRNKTEPFPVRLFNRTIFNIYSGFGPFSASNRAQTAQQHIIDLYNVKQYFTDSLMTEKKSNYINVVYQGNIITSVSEEDAIWENISQDSLASHYKESINKHILESKKEHSFENKIVQWSLVIGIAFAFIIMLWTIKKLFHLLGKKLLGSKNSKKEGLKIKNYQFINRRRLIRILLRSLCVLYIIVIFLSLYISLSAIFSIFPATEGWAHMLLYWIWIPLKELLLSFYHYIPKLIHIIIVLIIGKYIDKLLRYLSIEIRRDLLKIRGFHKDWASPTYKLLRICLIAFIIVLTFPYLPGADTDAFKGVSVFFGILISIGSSSAISNTIAGFIITYMRPFQEGDWIKVNDITGEVIEKTALITRLRTINNEDVTVPNSTILSNKTINYSSASQEKGLVIPVLVNIRYDVSSSIVNDLLIKAAIRTKDIEQTPTPYIFKNVLKDTYVTYQINAITTKPQNMYFIQSDLNENILKEFGTAGIDILSAQFYPNPTKN